MACPNILYLFAAGLFKKAITSSGSALGLNVIQRYPKLAAQRVAKLLGCNEILNKTENATKVQHGDCVYDNSSLILECLKLVDAKKLAELQKDSFVRGPCWCIFMNIYVVQFAKLQNLLRDPLSYFGPVIEQSSPANPRQLAVLSEHPYSIISTGRQAKIPWMTGVDADAGLIVSGGMFKVLRE